MRHWPETQIQNMKQDLVHFKKVCNAWYKNFLDVEKHHLIVKYLHACIPMFKIYNNNSIYDNDNDFNINK